jgi:polysaccharide export outer membrane protein
MKLFKIILVLSLSVFIALTSCVTSKKLTYLQYTGTPLDTIIMVTPSSYKILPFDNLYIRVITPDPQWSDMFNSIPANSSNSNMNEQSADMISYTVDADGTIELPYAGRFEVAGKTLNMVKTELENVLKGYVTDAALIVKMINNYINIIGEVKNPGRYPIYKDRMNIFQALAMAGDLGEFSNRRKLQIIRQTSVGTTIKEFSLTDRAILTSEFFYVMPNDVIYAQPIKGKFFQMNAFPYSIILSTITTIILILNVIK